MKAILYFVKCGTVRDSHREAAKAIASATNKRVVFRNSSVGGSERAEANEGVAGTVPEAYSAFPRYTDSGVLVGDSEPEQETPERTLNAIGLPDGDDNPEDRESLKKALDDEGIEYHANASTEKLVNLYMAHFYPEG